MYMDMEMFKIISFFVFVFLFIGLTIWYFISLDKQMKLKFKQETEKWEKFKSQIKPGVLLRIEKSRYTPFDESKYEIIEILEIKDGWVKYNFIDKNRKLKRDFIDEMRGLYEMGYEIVQPETTKTEYQEKYDDVSE